LDPLPLVLITVKNTVVGIREKYIQSASHPTSRNSKLTQIPQIPQILFHRFAVPLEPSCIIKMMLPPLPSQKIIQSFSLKRRVEMWKQEAPTQSAA
jgi:hypothetical protein